MNLALWVVQVLVAVAFGIAGYSKAFTYERARERMPWVRDVPPPFTRTIGVLEILGAIGLILPAITGVLPWLTPLAAAALALLQVVAIAFHITRQEWRNLPANAVLVALPLVAAYGRFAVVPF
ncbi:MAG TPA: DoxX family protein [Candidatus Limnocylindria bacterium]|jgi:uncharacterized membrane protein YphA (DoxX/SURF4 family)|nr:DoxX family protein [Candidatus Limnocylindria bacterium]